MATSLQLLHYELYNVGGQSRHVQLHPVAPPALDHRVVLYLPPEHLLAMRS